MGISWRKTGTVEECLKREIFEETNLEILDYKFLGYIDERIFQHFLAMMFIITKVEGELKCMGWKFIPLDLEKFKSLIVFLFKKPIEFDELKVLKAYKVKGIYEARLINGDKKTGKGKTVIEAIMDME